MKNAKFFRKISTWTNYSWAVREDSLYNKKYNDLLIAENVLMMIDILNDGKKKIDYWEYLDIKWQINA